MEANKQRNITLIMIILTTTAFLTAAAFGNTHYTIVCGIMSLGYRLDLAMQDKKGASK